MLQVTTTDFIKKFNALNNIIADVNVNHLLYGSQKIRRCILHPFADGERIGLCINEEDIYITMDELQSVCISEAECTIKSDVMELYIML